MFYHVLPKSGASNTGPSEADTPPPAARFSQDNQDRAQDVRNLDWTAEWPAILEDSPVAGEIEAAAWPRWRSGSLENDGDRDYHGWDYRGK